MGKPESQEDSHSSEVHSSESESSKDPTNDSAGESSESSEEQKKPQDHASHITTTSSSLESLNKEVDDVHGEVHTVMPSEESAASTNKPNESSSSQDDLSENEVQSEDDLGTQSHQDSQGDINETDRDKEISQDNAENTNRTPEEEFNVIYEEHDKKPDNLIPESMTHDKPDESGHSEHESPNQNVDGQTNESQKPEGNLPLPGIDNDENKPDQESSSINVDEPVSESDTTQSGLIHSDQESTISSEDSDELDDSAQDSGSTHSSEVSQPNKDDIDENINADVDNKIGEEEHFNTEGPALSHHDSEETMVTGDQEEDHKNTVLDGDDKLHDDEIGLHSATESPAHESPVHLSENDHQGSESSGKPGMDSIHDGDNDSITDNVNLDTVPSSESEPEKNRINTVGPETYTEVSVETVEVHTSTPEINAPQTAPTSPSSLFDNIGLSTKGPESGNQEQENDDNQGNQHQDTTATHDTSNKDDEHDSTTLFDTSNIPQHSEEGHCVIDGQVYQHNTQVHTSNACQVSCKCLNSIVHCQLVECPPPPTQYANCMPLQEPDSCCPSYTCGEFKLRYVLCKSILRNNLDRYTFFEKIEFLKKSKENLK